MAFDNHTLDCLWIAINALGGGGEAQSEFVRGYCEGVMDALVIVERLGGMDPQDRVRRENSEAYGRREELIARLAEKVVAPSSVRLVGATAAVGESGK